MTEMATPPAEATAKKPPPEEPPTEVEPKGKFRFPSAFTVLAIVAVAVWALAFIIPSGQYDLDDEGAPLPGTYQEVPSPQDFGEHYRVVVLGVMGGVDERQRPLPRASAERRQRRTLGAELLDVALAKLLEAAGLVPEPSPQLGTRRQRALPVVEFGLSD